MTTRTLPNGWTEVALGDVADINPSATVRPAASDMVPFVPMAAVDAGRTTVVAEARVPFEAAAGGTTPFVNGDVLVAKITPCFQNGKIAQVRTSRAGFGSTEFHVVRGRPARADGRYLVHYLRQPWLRYAGEKRMTGSGGQRRVPKNFLAELRIPLPPIDEQRRIAAVLDQADELRAKRHNTLAVLDSLTESIFLDMFGDPLQGGSDRTVVALGQLALQVTDGEHQTPPRSASGVKLLSARNVRDGYIDVADVDHVSQEIYDRLRQRCDPRVDDLLISCSGTIGRVSRITTDEPVALVRSVAYVKPDPRVTRPVYLERLLRLPALRRWMQSRAKSSSQANLFQGPIREMPILVPPLREQDSFVALATAHAEERAGCAASERRLDELFTSLQQRAFRGEL